MIENISDFLETFLLSLGVFAPILACFLIVIESILPVLPLCVFITINFYFFGKFAGFLLSWIFTCIGCYLSYVLGQDGNPISFGDPNNVNLEGYAKTEDIANEYAKSSDLDSKFATITTTDGLTTDLNNHTNDTVAHLTQAERDKLVPTEDLGD